MFAALCLLLLVAPAAKERRPVPAAEPDKIVVTVVDEEGAPVPDAQVAARPADVRVGALVEGSTRLRGLGWRSWTATTDADGRATLRGLEPRAWCVAAGRPVDYGFHFSEPLEPGRAPASGRARSGRATRAAAVGARVIRAGRP